LSDIKFATGKCRDERIGIKWLRKYVAANEQIVNISPTVNHCHNVVNEALSRLINSLRAFFCDSNMFWIR
jgi:hypothetical protein